MRKFEDAVLRRGSADPDVALAVDDDRLQSRGPLRNIAGPSPGTDHVAFRIELDNFRPADAAIDPRRVIAAANFIAVGVRSTIQKPDVVVFLLHIQSRDLLHAPAIRQGLAARTGPRGIRAHPAHPRLALVFLFLLLASERAALNTENATSTTNSKRHDSRLAPFFTRIHGTHPPFAEADLRFPKRRKICRRASSPLPQASVAFVFHALLNLVDVNFAGRVPIRRHRYKKTSELRNQKSCLSARARRNIPKGLIVIRVGFLVDVDRARAA